MAKSIKEVCLTPMNKANMSVLFDSASKSLLVSRCRAFKRVRGEVGRLYVSLEAAFYPEGSFVITFLFALKGFRSA